MLEGIVLSANNRSQEVTKCFRFMLKYLQKGHPLYIEN